MKNTILIIIITFISFISCSKKPILDQLFEVKKTDIMFGGMIISASSLQLEDKNGISGINLENPQLDKLRNANEIITDSSEAVLILSYPLKKIIGYRIQNDKGFNMKNIVTELSKVYSEIYSNKEKFGICCDELSDLELKTIIAFEVNGQIYLESIVESTK
jgi:hypothetical protein